MRSILGLFGKSPFGPLVEHAGRVKEAVVLVDPLFEAFTAGEWERVEEVYGRISKLEHKADVLKNEIRDHLPKSMLLPVDRGDVLLFLAEQDRMADSAEDLGVLLTMRQTPTPPDMREGVKALVAAVLRVSDAWFDTVGDLPVLQEASFSGPEVERVLARIHEISDLEWEADKQQQSVSKAIVAHEGELDPVSVMFWMNILREVGMLANRAESTANRLRLMLAKR